MLISNCCGARFYEPDYPDNDICSSCKEHASPMEEEVVHLPSGGEGSHQEKGEKNESR